MSFWPNDIFRIDFGGGYIDIGVSKYHVLSVKIKCEGTSNSIDAHHHLSEENAKALWVELNKLFKGKHES